MFSWWLIPSIVGLALMVMSLVGSELDFGLNFGSDLSGHAVTAMLGAFLGIGGGVGVIASSIGLGLVPTAVVSAAAGFASAYAAGRLTSFLVGVSSDGGDSSIMDAVGKTFTAEEDMEAGAIGVADVTINDSRQRLYYKPEVAVRAGEELKVTGVDLENNVLSAEPTALEAASNESTQPASSGVDPVDAMRAVASKARLEAAARAGEQAGSRGGERTVEHASRVERS